jgi:hypothetical protein
MPEAHQNPDPLLSATYASLNCRAVTGEAKALVDQLTSMVEDKEKRRYKRGKSARTSLMRAVAGFLGDLLHAAANEKYRGWVYHAVRPETFSGELVSYRTFSSLAKSLVELGLIEHKPGNRSRVATRFRAKRELLDIAAGCQITPDNCNDNFVAALPRHPIILKTSSQRMRRSKVPGRMMGFERTPQVQALEADMHRLNRFLNGFEISGGRHRGYRRIFNQGDVEGFAWNKGGRLYSQGGGYQSLKSNARFEMTINGEPVGELDVTASYLTLLHGLSRLPFDPSSDPYELPGIERDIVKGWTVATLGNAGHLRRWPTKQVKDYEEKNSRAFPKKVRARDVRSAMEQKHPVFLTWDDQKISWADLMFAESEAILGTMLTLMDEHGVPSLSVHDSLIVGRRHLELARVILENQYERVCGIKPVLKEKIVQPVSEPSYEPQKLNLPSVSETVHQEVL